MPRLTKNQTRIELTFVVEDKRVEGVLKLHPDKTLEACMSALMKLLDTEDLILIDSNKLSLFIKDNSKLVITRG